MKKIGCNYKSNSLSLIVFFMKKQTSYLSVLDYDLML